MKKNYFKPTTKLVTVNVSAIMEQEINTTSQEEVEVEPSDVPLF